MMLNQHQAALDDARHCISIDDQFVKGHLRVAKCHMMLGNPSLSIDYYDKAISLQSRNTQAVNEVSGCVLTLNYYQLKQKRQCLSVMMHMDKAKQEFDKCHFREVSGDVSVAVVTCGCIVCLPHGQVFRSFIVLRQV